MTIAPAVQQLPFPLFRDDEPVLQSHALLDSAVVPRFGQTDVWDFNRVVRRNANLTEGEWRLSFSKTLIDPAWNLTAREACMIMANPRHEALIDAGVHLRPQPSDLSTVRNLLSALRRIAKWATENGLSPAMGGWRETDFKRCVAALQERGLKPGSIAGIIGTFKHLHNFAPALSLGGPKTDPWKGKSARKAANYIATGQLSTPAIPPQIWFPLVRAAWVHIHTFAPDVLRAATRYDELKERVRPFTRGQKDRHLEAWLADPASRIPLHAPAAGTEQSHEQRQERVDWYLLALMIGFDPEGSSFDHSPAGKRRRTRIAEILANGYPTTTGIIGDLVHVARDDGTVGPWHPGLDPQAVTKQLLMLRNAAFCLIAALSMMRDSEIHEIRRGSVVEHYSSPAIASTLDKNRPGRPGKHWWITEPAAQAIIVAEAVSDHERVFAPKNTDVAVLHSHNMIDTFIAAVNESRAHSGLAEIPAGKVRPHMFRRTMSMLTDQFPGSEIALGLQLKHVAARALANRSTLSYAASDISWASELQTALDAGRFRRFTELFGQHKAGQPIGYGPGAQRIKEVFDEIEATLNANGGDARVEADLLHKARITIRFGTLNNCLFDLANPAGAICLENAVVPTGHSGPLHERCRPDKCRNSVIGVEHVAIHDSHRRRQLALLDTPRLPGPRQELIKREIQRAEAVLAHINKEQQ